MLRRGFSVKSLVRLLGAPGIASLGLCRARSKRWPCVFLSFHDGGPPRSRLQSAPTSGATAPACGYRPNATTPLASAGPAAGFGGVTRFKTKLSCRARAMLPRLMPVLRHLDASTMLYVDSGAPPSPRHPPRQRFPSSAGGPWHSWRAADAAPCLRP